MILILLAAQFGAAQEAIVVYEGAETSHDVNNHPGNEYRWEVYKSFNPDIEADPSEYYFTVPENTNTVTVHWNRAGVYYLKVNETDPTGCSNLKALAISVISNKRTIGFEELSSSECYQPPDNGFNLSIKVFDDGGLPLDASYFPIDVSFTVNGSTYSQLITYVNQEVLISTDMFVLTPNADTEVVVEITQAVDNQNGGIQSSNKAIHTHSIFAPPELEFVSSNDLVQEGSHGTYEVQLNKGNTENTVYSWRLDPEDGSSTDLELINENVADILWDGPIGIYKLYVSVSDGNACTSDTIIRSIEVKKNDPAPIIIYAGADTTMGTCQPYLFTNVYPAEDSYTYSWSPTIYLDDPTIANPVFTPGETTTYVLTLTTLTGGVVKDTVTITVAKVLANAGDDIVMEEGATAMLDASASFGEELQYLWTTANGNIQGGENTANPIINSTGTYYLEVTDFYACKASDSIVVSRVTLAPIARNDYDTTVFQTAVNIPVLNNDEDLNGNLDPSSLSIVQYPLNGSVYINYDNYTVTYTPADGFTGNDIFEYQICNLSNKCDNASVYVVVIPLDFLLPEAFTPNGDNINDYFEIRGIEYYEGNSITIINRWGEKVYEAKNYGIDTTPKYWDGKWTMGGNNKDLPTGTYFYVLDLGNGQKPIAGSIYIDR